MPFTYLASPYSHPDEKVRHARYLGVCELARELIQNNITPYSPIMHFHHFKPPANMSYDAKSWERVNFDMLASASWMIVCGISGWEESIGVKGEIDFCRRFNLPISIATFDPGTGTWTIKSFL